MSDKKPLPLNPPKTPSRCPVCGEVSYSRAGVHPQCSMKQADEKHKDRIKREKLLAKEEGAVTPASGIAPWQKSCPKCNALHHVRKTTCTCGYTFDAKPRPPTVEGDQI